MEGVTPTFTRYLSGWEHIMFDHPVPIRGGFRRPIPDVRLRTPSFPSTGPRRAGLSPKPRPASPWSPACPGRSRAWPTGPLPVWPSRRRPTGQIRAGCPAWSEAFGLGQFPASGGPRLLPQTGPIRAFPFVRHNFWALIPSKKKVKKQKTKAVGTLSDKTQPTTVEKK